MLYATEPTEREVASLSNLHSPQPPYPNAFSVRETLAGVFSVCRNTWVSDFLFNSDVTPLSALTSPINLRYGHTCVAFITSIDAGTTDPRTTPKLFDSHTKSSYIFVPAFSVDTVSVGFGVHQCSFIERSKWGSDLPRHRSRRHFRFVRDDASGLLIHVYDSPEDGLIKIDYMALQTARRRRRVYVSIRRADVLEMACSSSFSIDGLMRAAVVVQSIDELRRCPLCRGAANGSCECRYVITPPKHPLDFYSMHNFGVHHGFFLGSVSSVLFKDGADVMTAQLSSALDVECSTDFDLIQQLSRWAISDKLKDVTIDPLSVMMSVGDNADFYEGNNKKSNQTGNTDSYSVNTSAYDGSIALEMVVDEAIREPAVIQEVIPEDGECSSIDLLTNGDAQTEMDKFANSVKHDEKAEQGDEDKEQRAALRRQRNREAATRSNMKRKLKNDRLKSDLQESRGRAAELRARELVLREENIRLRRMLTR